MPRHVKYFHALWLKSSRLLYCLQTNHNFFVTKTQNQKSLASSRNCPPLPLFLNPPLKPNQTKNHHKYHELLKQLSPNNPAWLWEGFILTLSVDAHKAKIMITSKILIWVMCRRLKYNESCFGIWILLQKSEVGAVHWRPSQLSICWYFG